MALYSNHHGDARFPVQSAFDNHDEYRPEGNAPFNERFGNNRHNRHKYQGYGNRYNKVPNYNKDRHWQDKPADCGPPQRQKPQAPRQEKKNTVSTNRQPAQ